MYVSCDNNTITENHISDCYSSIRLQEACTGNTITLNTLTNSPWGTNLWNSSNNTIYLNNSFSSGGYSDSANTWHSPTPITYSYNGTTYTDYLGNYWSDYAGMGGGGDGDGVGDTPYALGSDQDNYPLIEPFENYLSVATVSSPTGLEKISPDNNPLPAFKWNAASGAVSYGVKMDSGAWVNIGEKLTYVQPTLLSKGSHTFSVRAVDASSNAGPEATLAFNVSVVADLANTKIVFESWRDGDPEIYVMNVDFTGLQQLTFNTAGESKSAWSPDGTKIAFPSNRDGNNEVYLMNRDGSGQTNLTCNSAYDAGPSWSPDGSKIAFWTDRDGNREIYIMNADGSGQTRLTNNPADDMWPSWSPDGSQIAFESGRDGNSEIYILSLDTLVEGRLTASPAGSKGFFFPSWSPDGSRIAFNSTRADGYDIYVMNSDGSGTPTNITPGTPEEQFRAQWSPDGSKMAISYAESYYHTWTMATMNADGSGKSVLPAVSSQGWPSWSPFLATGSADTTPPNTTITFGPSGTVDHNNPTFTWTGVDDVTPASGLVYSYRLEGVDSTWSPWTLDTSKQYTNVPAGDYIFKVKARDQAGNVDPTPAEKTFTITWSFAVITDLHIGRGYSDYCGGGWNDNSATYWDNQTDKPAQDYYLTQRLESEVQTIRRLRATQNIRFVAVLGDISEDGEYSELKTARDILNGLNFDVDGDSKLDMVYIPLLGNHDLWPSDEPRPDIFWTVFAKQFTVLRSQFGDGLQFSGRLDYVNYSLTVGGVQFLCLDFNSRGILKARGYFHEATEDFVNTILPDDPMSHTPTVVLSHHPLLETHDLWNKLGIDDRVGMLLSAIDDSDFGRLAEALRGHDILASYAGHIHGFYDPDPTIPGTGLVWMNANRDYSAAPFYCDTPNDIPVVTTEALMTGSNEPASKYIVRVVKMTDGHMQDGNTLGQGEGEVAARAVNPYFKTTVRDEYDDLRGDYWKEVLQGKIGVDFEGYAFTKRAGDGYSLAYHWDFGDGSDRTCWITEWDKKCDEDNCGDPPLTHFYQSGPFGAAYEMTLTVWGMTLSGETIHESISKTIFLPPSLSRTFLVESLCPVDLVVKDPDGLTIDKQTNAIDNAIYRELDINGDGDLDDLVIIVGYKIGDYLVSVVPETGAMPNDTYTLFVSSNGQDFLLADNVPISEIPAQGYNTRVTEEQEAPLKIFPVADSGGPHSGLEGSQIAFNASDSYDPDGTIVSYQWAFGDGSTATGTPMPTHAYGDNGIYTLTLTVSDNDGLTSTASSTVTVNNVRPAVGAINAPVDPRLVKAAINASASFSDPGILDTHTAIWDWGDGITSQGAVAESNGSGTVSASHTYSAAGIYTIKLTVTDDDGAPGQSQFQYLVVYDPNAGFLEGDGRINSPAGAYVANPSLIGRATFEFGAGYQKKCATKPTGSVEFAFPQARLTFQSTGYDWLVIAGGKAYLKGSGRINGKGNYGFLLSAIDGQIKGCGGVDKFRIKIWDKATGKVVYDNQMGAADDAAATTAIGSGSIVIHRTGCMETAGVSNIPYLGYILAGLLGCFVIALGVFTFYMWGRPLPTRN